MKTCCCVFIGLLLYIATVNVAEDGFFDNNPQMWQEDGDNDSGRCSDQNERKWRDYERKCSPRENNHNANYKDGLLKVIAENHNFTTQQLKAMSDEIQKLRNQVSDPECKSNLKKALDDVQRLTTQVNQLSSSNSDTQREAQRLQAQVADLTNKTCSDKNDARWDKDYSEYQAKCATPKVKLLESKVFSTYCNGKTQIRSRFRTKTLSNAPSKAKCLDLCASSDNSNSEVAEWTVDNQCYCTRIQARFYHFMPRRYLQCASTASVILYREDRLQASLSAIGTPYVFYALDEVSGVENTGSLEGTQHDAVFNAGTGTYDCPGLTQTGTKHLQFIATKNQFLKAGQNLDITNSKGFTMMAWTKMRTWTGYLEIYLSTPIITYMGVYPTPERHIFNNVADSVSTGTTHAMGTWYHEAMSLTPSQWSGLVNGVPVVSASTPAGQTASNLFIGSYQGTSGHWWDGCIAHVAVFQRALNQEEVKLVSSVFRDELF